MRQQLFGTPDRSREDALSVPVALGLGLRRPGRRAALGLGAAAALLLAACAPAAQPAAPAPPAPAAAPAKAAEAPKPAAQPAKPAAEAPKPAAQPAKPAAPAAKPAAAPGKEVTLKIGVANPPAHPTVRALRQVAEMLATKSNGRVKLEVFPG
ncbi:MAG: hypothetical protein HY691_13300, partial [Chloroflexi bacterium]|nr:hypothetical protein [Chloroflexota bacterium]